jgi:hypothetical protein
LGRDTIVTEKTTVVVLPTGSQIQQINPVFESAFTGSWSVDFGGGTSYKATFEKRPDGFVVKETIVTSGAGPSNLVDEKQSEIVLESLEITPLSKSFFRATGFLRSPNPPHTL